MLSAHARRTATGLLAALVVIAGAAPVAQAEHYSRSFSWSGYRWKVRVAHHENPDRNDWADAPANVRVRPDGTLRLAITGTGAARRSVEVVTRRELGYGRYTWVVGSSLSPLNLYSVLALFTDDDVHRSPYGEQIFEFGRWGDPTALPGWAVSWSAHHKAYDSFGLTTAAPYVAQITYRRGSARIFLRDATGTVLYDRTRPLANDGRYMAARMSYWMSRGAPATLTVPPMTIRSFHFTPLARLPTPGP